MTTIPHTCVNAAATVDGSSPSRCEACLDYYRGQAPAPFLAGMEEAARVCDDYAATNEDAWGDRLPPSLTKTPWVPARDCASHIRMAATATLAAAPRLYPTTPASDAAIASWAETHRVEGERAEWPHRIVGELLAALDAVVRERDDARAALDATSGVVFDSIVDETHIEYIVHDHATQLPDYLRAIAKRMRAADTALRSFYDPIVVRRGGGPR